MLIQVQVTKGTPIRKKAYDMFSLYLYLIINLVFFHLDFWSGSFALTAPFHDHCLNLPSLYNTAVVTK